MRVGAIDSAGLSGWAVIEGPAGRERLVAKGTFPGRYHDQIVAGAAIVMSHEPDLVAVEAAFVRLNADVGLMLAEWVGRWRQELESRGAQTTSVRASQWQAQILGGLISLRAPRSARKAAAVQWAVRRFGLPFAEDEADAAGLATYVVRREGRPRTRDLFASPHQKTGAGTR